MTWTCSVYADTWINSMVPAINKRPRVYPSDIQCYLLRKSHNWASQNENITCTWIALDFTMLSHVWKCSPHKQYVNHDKVQWNRSSWLDNDANLCTTLFCKKLIMLAVTNPVMCHLKFLLQHFCKLYQREIFYNYFNKILCNNLSIKVEAFWSQVLLWNLDLLLSLGGLLNIHKEFWILVCRENVQLPNDKS